MAAAEKRQSAFRGVKSSLCAERQLQHNPIHGNSGVGLTGRADAKQWSPCAAPACGFSGTLLHLYEQRGEDRRAGGDEGQHSKSIRHTQKRHLQLAGLEVQRQFLAESGLDANAIAKRLEAAEPLGVALLEQLANASPSPLSSSAFRALPLEVPRTVCRARAAAGSAHVAPTTATSSISSLGQHSAAALCSSALRAEADLAVTEAAAADIHSRVCKEEEARTRGRSRVGAFSQLTREQQLKGLRMMGAQGPRLVIPSLYASGATSHHISVLPGRPATALGIVSGPPGISGQERSGLARSTHTAPAGGSLASPQLTWPADRPGHSRVPHYALPLQRAGGMQPEGSTDCSCSTTAPPSSGDSCLAHRKHVPSLRLPSNIVALFDDTFRKEIAESSSRWSHCHAAMPPVELRHLVQAEGIAWPHTATYGFATKGAAQQVAKGELLPQQGLAKVAPAEQPTSGQLVPVRPPVDQGGLVSKRLYEDYLKIMGVEEGKK